MKRPLIVGPDGVVASATSREMAHLTHCLERDVKASPSKVVSQNVTKQTPCSCGGSNENCARCYGRGFIEGGGHGTRASRTRLPKRKNTVGNPHPSVPAVPQATIGMRSGNTTRVSLKNCPLCNSQVRDDKLQSHMSGRCPLRPDKSLLSTRPVRPNRRNRNRLQNAVPIVQHGIAETVQQFHAPSKPERPSKLGRRGPKYQQVKKGQHSMGTASPESARHKGKVEVERPAWWDNLDATKNCGYPAREEGRYGSYPSHDGFDDESKP